MSKKTISDSIKVASLIIFPGTTIAGSPFQVNMGKNEVILLHAIYVWWKGVPAAGSNMVRMGLWRKTDTNPTGVDIVHSDMVWATAWQYQFITESIPSSGSEYIKFPKPLVFIRAPRLVHIRSVMLSVSASMQIYYTIEKLSDTKIAELMVKDHA